MFLGQLMDDLNVFDMFLEMFFDFCLCVFPSGVEGVWEGLKDPHRTKFTSLPFWHDILHICYMMLYVHITFTSSY